MSIEWKDRPLARMELWDGHTLLGVVAETERGDYDAVLMTTGVLGKYVGRYEHETHAKRAVWEAIGPER